MLDISLDDAIDGALDAAHPEEILRWSSIQFGDRVTISTSLQAGTVALIDMADAQDLPIEAITLDTHKHFPETYDMIDTLRTRYRIPIREIHPSDEDVQALNAAMREELNSDDIRNQPKEWVDRCCYIRKEKPLARALSNYDAWISGTRRDESDTRKDIKVVDHDRKYQGKIKISPLAYWTKEQLDAYIKKHKVPQHPLYSQGYASIGCEPCTIPSDNKRDGRWAWLDKTECGLHTIRPSTNI